MFVGFSNMITSKELKRANELVDQINRLEEILRHFDSPYVETTIGLVTVNAASKHKTGESEDANYFQSEHQDMVTALKNICRKKIEEKVAKAKVSLCQIIEDEPCS